MPGDGGLFIEFPSAADHCGDLPRQLLGKYQLPHLDGPARSGNDQRQGTDRLATREQGHRHIGLEPQRLGEPEVVVPVRGRPQELLSHVPGPL